MIIGTSLVVHPFADLPNYTKPSVPRIVLNYEPLDDFDRPNDVYIPGDCDASIWTLCEKLGWTDDLQNLHREVNGVEHKLGRGKEEEEGVETEAAVDKLTRELAEELRLDKEEDGELRRMRDEEGPALKADTWDDDTVVITKKDGEPPKGSDNGEAKGQEKVNASKGEDKPKGEDREEEGAKAPSDPKL